MSRFLILLLLLIFCYWGWTFGQDTSLHIKEDYDRYNRVLLERYRPCSIGTAKDHTVFGDGMSHILDGYLTMYETTGDKDYLYRFMTQSICMLENRHDVAAISSEPRWGDITYEEGNILGAFARGAHFFLVEHPELLQVDLYPFEQFSQNAFQLNFHTINDFANWLLTQTQRSFDWLLSQGYWDNRYGFMNTPNAGQALIINMQVGFTRCAFFLAQVTKSPKYIQLSERIGNLCKGEVRFTDPKKKVLYGAPVFQLNKDNAYWWYHLGWRVKPSKPPVFRRKKDMTYGYLATHTEFIEDMSHGAVVLYLPLMYYRFSAKSPFDSIDMQRFRRTFTHNLNDGRGGFYNAVNGTDGPVSDNYCATCPRNYHAMKSLMYAPYASFDEWSSGDLDVYPIIRSFYQKEVAGLVQPPKDYCCGMNKGHAELVQQQWLREKINLCLGPRLLVYNQNFHISGTLRIEPESPESFPFALPIHSESTFVIQPSVEAVFSAEEIQLMPGTEVRAGAEVRCFVKR
jgi:hypothetical protein